MTKFLDGATPFLLPGGKKGILLLHGFTGTPAEMALLGKALQTKGYTVLAPRLCGHGTTPEEMAATSWENWYHSACDGYFILRGLCEDISVIGLSMGGLLALRLGQDFPVCRVATLSAPIHIADRRVKMLPPPEFCVDKYVPKHRRQIPGLAARYCVSYKKMPLSGIHCLLELLHLVMADLAAFQKPLLVMQSRADHTVLPESGQYIYDHVGSAEKELVWLEKSGHLITLDQEREIVFEKCAAFID